MEIEIISVCRKWKCEVDYSSRSTGQITCIYISEALCGVFDLKFNRIHLSQIIFEVWVVYGQLIIDLPVSEIEQRYCFPLRAKTVWISLRKHEKTFNCFEISHTKEAEVRSSFQCGLRSCKQFFISWRLKCYCRFINIKIILRLRKYCQNGIEMVWKAHKF